MSSIGVRRLDLEPGYMESKDEHICSEFKSPGASPVHRNMYDSPPVLQVQSDVSFTPNTECSMDSRYAQGELHVSPWNKR